MPTYPIWMVRVYLPTTMTIVKTILIWFLLIKDRGSERK